MLSKGLYKHYKGNFYIVEDQATHSESIEELVIYRSLKDGRLWARPEKMFDDVVDTVGTKRFTHIPALDVKTEWSIVGGVECFVVSWTDPKTFKENCIVVKENPK